jgi:hypothetical protein
METRIPARMLFLNFIDGHGSSPLYFRDINAERKPLLKPRG